MGKLGKKKDRIERKCAGQQILSKEEQKDLEEESVKSTRYIVETHDAWQLESLRSKRRF
jgi:hypothetical protein